MIMLSRKGITSLSYPAGALFLTFLILQFVSCSSDNTPRYPEDHERFQRINVAVESLRVAYVDQDLTSIQNLLLPVEKLEKLEEDIKKDFSTYQEISLDFFVDRIMVDTDTIDVFLHWQGRWNRASPQDGSGQERERGHGMLRWVGDQSILLTDVEGDLPFGQAERQPLPSQPNQFTP